MCVKGTHRGKVHWPFLLLLLVWFSAVRWATALAMHIHIAIFAPSRVLLVGIFVGTGASYYINMPKYIIILTGNGGGFSLW